MKVYRIEHGEQRFGPYVPTLFALSEEQDRLRREAVRSVDDVRHPSPYSDGLGELAPGEYSCFTTIKSLRAWFDDVALHLLRQAGFRAHMYEVDEELVRIGATQAVFLRDQATLRGAVAVIAS